MLLCLLAYLPLGITSYANSFGPKRVVVFVLFCFLFCLGLFFFHLEFPFVFNSSLTCFAFLRRVSISSIEGHVELVVGASLIGKFETGYHKKTISCHVVITKRPMILNAHFRDVLCLKNLSHRILL